MNPLLAKVKLPGRVFQLPSKGLFYEGKGVLAPTVKDAEVQVKPMSALCELKLRSADLLLSGKIIRELCEECIPEILRPEQLVAQDVDAVFAYLRLVTHGSNVKVTTIHDCDNALMHEYNIDLESMLQKPNNIILDHKEMIYVTTLSNGQIVRTKPNTYADSMNLMTMRQEVARQEANGDKPDEKLLVKISIMDLLAVLESVEDDGEVVDDVEMLEEWIRAIPRPLLDELMVTLRKGMKWGFDFTATLKCPDCGEEFDYALDLDPISFFFG